jgi:hypothetical protein
MPPAYDALTAQAIFLGDWTVTYTRWFGGTILPEAVKAAK